MGSLTKMKGRLLHLAFVTRKFGFKGAFVYWVSWSCICMHHHHLWLHRKDHEAKSKNNWTHQVCKHTIRLSLLYFQKQNHFDIYVFMLRFPAYCLILYVCRAMGMASELCNSLWSRVTWLRCRIISKVDVFPSPIICHEMKLIHRGKVHPILSRSWRWYN